MSDVVTAKERDAAAERLGIPLLHSLLRRLDVTPARFLRIARLPEPLRGDDPGRG